MRETLSVVLAPVILAVMAFTVTPPTETATTLPKIALSGYTVPAAPPPIAAIEASGDVTWDSDTFEVTILPPPPVHTYPRIPRDYGPTPALTGPILAIAANYLGIMYQAGGESPSGFDCSGFVQYVYAEAGYSIPRTVAGIRNIGTVTDDPQPGDIIVMAHHVALWVAPGWLVDSGRPGLVTQERPIWTSAYVVIHVE